MNFYSITQVAKSSNRSRFGIYKLFHKYNLGCRCGETIILTEEMKIILMAAPSGPLSYITVKRIDECYKPKLYSADELSVIFDKEPQNFYKYARTGQFGRKAGIHTVYTEEDKEILEEYYASK